MGTYLCGMKYNIQSAIFVLAGIEFALTVRLQTFRLRYIYFLSPPAKCNTYTTQNLVTKRFKFDSTWSATKVNINLAAFIGIDGVCENHASNCCVHNTAAAARVPLRMC